MAEGGSSSNSYHNQGEPNTSSSLKWIPTKRGRYQPYLHGFNYRMSKEGSDGTKYWTCSEENCKAKLHTKSDGTYLEKGEHYHGEHVIKVARKELAHELKTKAKDSNFQKMGEIYKTTVNQFDQEGSLSQAQRSLVLKSGYESSRSVMYRARASSLPPLPKKRAELVNLPEDFTEFTHLGQVYNIILSNEIVGQFDDSESSLEISVGQMTLSSQSHQPEVIDSDDDELNYVHSASNVPSQPTSMAPTDANDDDEEQEEEDEDRCIVLGIKSNLKFLSETISPNGSVATDIRIFADGTFKTCPKLFYQVYTIHSIVKGQMFPIIYALLPNKKSITYEHLLRVVKQELYLLGIEWTPASFQIDFESGMIKAIRKVLPDCSIKGCYFHYCQAIIHKSSNLGLTGFYVVPNHIVRKIIKYCMALPLIPPTRLNEALVIIKSKVDSISGNQPFHEASNTFIKYFEKTWFGLESRPALFPKQMWSQYNTFQNRTNSRLEAFHRNFNDSLSPHSNIWLFLQQVLTNLQSDLIAIESLLHGGTSAARTRDDQLDKNNRIAFFIEQLEIGENSLLDTLDHLSTIVN